MINKLWKAKRENTVLGRTNALTRDNKVIGYMERLLYNDEQISFKDKMWNGIRVIDVFSKGTILYRKI
ncbi:hypothetical protein O9G_001838 [Rozella allomycis CSF55]|uniref:Uncharacterized protein n=1 Tax=Rozella allomycis (strain CSF55) TaxID=988480 RepID=A0A075AVQ5_ROZAC|nr:hypothetical protein O9G_001838 [Rozella allomycis CSF55]|eukprot:EPZ34225.1 hypothetical protein O9G_001838 [Rozella allomycis CSF55]